MSKLYKHICAVRTLVLHFNDDNYILHVYTLSVSQDIIQIHQQMKIEENHRQSDHIMKIQSPMSVYDH